MNRLVIAAAMLLSATSAFATDLIPLQKAPAPVAGTYAPLTRCAASGFAGTRVVGVCQYGFPSAGRYQKAVTVNYSVSWDQDGIPTLGAVTTAVPNFNPTKSTVEIDGDYYYYVASNALGQEVVSDQTSSYLVR